MALERPVTASAVTQLRQTNVRVQSSPAQPLKLVVGVGTETFAQAKQRSGYCAPSQDPVRPREVAGVSPGVALQIVLMLRFRLPELAHGRDFRDHLSRPQAGGLDIVDRVATAFDFSARC